MDYVEDKYFLTKGKAILFLLIIIIVGILIFIIKNSNAVSNKDYLDFEKELVDAAENYVIIKNVKIKDGEEIRISLSKLDDASLIFNELKDKCDGYVIVESEKNKVTENYEISYRSYIRCSNKYMTTNYSDY